MSALAQAARNTTGSFTPPTGLLASSFDSASVLGGNQGAWLSDRLERLTAHFALPISRQEISLARRFRELADEWRRATQWSSSASEIALHPAYQQVIGLGSAALPLILRDLQVEATHWFWALRAITGIDPVRPEDRGRIQEMREAWLNWGRASGLIE